MGQRTPPPARLRRRGVAARSRRRAPTRRRTFLPRDFSNCPISGCVRQRGFVFVSSSPSVSVKSPPRDDGKHVLCFILITHKVTSATTFKAEPLKKTNRRLKLGSLKVHLTIYFSPSGLLKKELVVNHWSLIESSSSIEDVLCAHFVFLFGAMFSERKSRRTKG